MALTQTEEAGGGHRADRFSMEGRALFFLICFTGDVYVRVGPLPHELGCMVGGFEYRIIFGFICSESGAAEISLS
jgi:hypothetical protein